MQWTETAAAWLRLPELFPRRTRTPKVTSPNSQAYHHRLPIQNMVFENFDNIKQMNYVSAIFLAENKYFKYLQKFGASFSHF